MQENLSILITMLIVVAALGQDFDPNFTYADFNRTFPRSYQGEEWDIHEAAFKKNYAELLRLHSEGKDVAVNEKLDWTDDQKKSTSIFIQRFFELSASKLRSSSFH